MKTTSILLSVLLLGIAGCSADEQQNSSLTNDKGEYAINFSGNMDLTVTKAADPKLASGKKVKISVFKSSDGDLSSATAVIAAKGYTAGEEGALTGDGDSPYVMYLALGSYNFYAVSCNTNADTNIPAFTSGESAVLANGVDYLWAEAKSVTVENSGATVTLPFKHKAVNVVINLESGTGLELIDWQTSGDTDDDATISLPDPGSTCKMTLNTGAIAQATGIKSGGEVNDRVGNMTTTAVGSKKSTASYIMLPLAQSVDLTVTFKVKVNIGGTNASGDSKVYTATITTPTGGFVSGKQYNYKATLKANTITFSGATVAAWDGAGDSAEELKPTEPSPEP